MRGIIILNHGTVASKSETAAAAGHLSSMPIMIHTHTHTHTSGGLVQINRFGKLTLTKVNIARALLILILDLSNMACPMKRSSVSERTNGQMNER